MKKNKSRKWWILIVLFLIAAAILAGYSYFGKEKTPKKPAVPRGTEEPPTQIEEEASRASTAPKIKEKIPPEEDLMEKSGPAETGRSEAEDPCISVDEQMSDFFKYLDGREYLRKMGERGDTYNRFVELVNKLSSRPPVPAGEGLDKEIIIKNIFHFFRVLGRKDIRFIRGILRHESDTLESNLELFFEWFMLGDKCPVHVRIRPSFETAYLYAGYLLNTIGGESYLFRRNVDTRLLVSYYCVLILHEADKKGTNRFGIDVFPRIETLIEEISQDPNLKYRVNYVHRLTEIQDYYLETR